MAEKQPSGLHSLQQHLQTVHDSLPHQAIDLAHDSFCKAIAGIDTVWPQPTEIRDHVVQASAGLLKAETMFMQAGLSIELYCGALGIGIDPIGQQDIIDAGTPDTAGDDELPTYQERRKELHRTHGAVTYTAINKKMLRDIAAKQYDAIPRVLPAEYAGIGLTATTEVMSLAAHNPAGVSLFMAANHIAKLVPTAAEVKHMYNFSRDDSAALASYTFQEGFADLTFSWYFSAAVANSVADHLVQQGAITAGQKNALTLTDWANMVSSKWFSKLMHSLALNRNNAYRQFGKNIKSVQEGAFGDMLRRNIPTLGDEPLFGGVGLQEAGSSPADIAVSLSRELTKRIRAEMREAVDGSVGCPVARTSLLLPHTFTHNPHLQDLLAAEEVHIIAEQSNDSHLRVVQGQTSIDDTLQLIATQLRDYQTRFGNPQVKFGKAEGVMRPYVKHRR